MPIAVFSHTSISDESQCCLAFNSVGNSWRVFSAPITIIITSRPTNRAIKIEKKPPYLWMYRRPTAGGVAPFTTCCKRVHRCCAAD